MAKGVPVTQQEFEKIKTLTSTGVPKKMISDLTKRDDGTIKLIQESENFESYRKARKEINNRKLHKPSNPDGQVTIEDFTAEDLKTEEPVKTAINMLNGIGIQFHTLAEYLYKNFVKENQK